MPVTSSYNSVLCSCINSQFLSNHLCMINQPIYALKYLLIRMPMHVHRYLDIEELTAVYHVQMRCVCRRSRFTANDSPEQNNGIPYICIYIYYRLLRSRNNIIQRCFTDIIDRTSINYYYVPNNK